MKRGTRFFTVVATAALTFGVLFASLGKEHMFKYRYHRWYKHHHSWHHHHDHLDHHQDCHNSKEEWNGDEKNN